MRAALYARVSTEEQVEGYSLDAQRRAFREFCQSKGWIVTEEYVEGGRSAHTEDLNKRPVFKDAIQAALDHRFDVLVVHKIDRFSRKLKVTLESFDKLHKSGIGFVSISEQMDFSTPTGQVFLAMVGAFSQFYSDNLSHETKKGWAERRAQGLYCGLLPFGAKKGADGVPDQHPTNFEGLQRAFHLAAQGRSDKDIAQWLTSAGYRTSGNQGNRAFSKDTVRGLLTNRFYLGFIPDGKGDWLLGRHEPLISQDLWDQVQEMRSRNRKSQHGCVTRKGKVVSLTGLAFCWRCKGRIHVAWSVNGRVRLGCYNRLKGWNCDQPSGVLDIYEAQIRDYLATFQVPTDYREQIVVSQDKLNTAYSDRIKEKARLETNHRRAKELYEWGDISRGEYLKKKDEYQRQIASLGRETGDDGTLERLRAFLVDITKAWDAATPEQKNKLARCLFEEVWFDGKAVVAVKPQPEFEPFFRLNYEAYLADGVTGNNEVATPRGFGASSN